MTASVNATTSCSSPGCAKKVITFAQPDAADQYGSAENDHFFFTVVRVARNPRCLLETDDRAAAARVVVPEQAALAPSFGGLPLPVYGFVTSIAVPSKHITHSLIITHKKS